MSLPLKAEFDFYRAHQAELARQFRGRYLAIKGNRVLGDYDSELAAFVATSKTEEAGTFLIQRCDSDTDSYTQTFRTRAVFA